MAISDYMPDFSDPNTMALFGSLAGLAQSATPQYGVRKINANSALAGVLSNVMGGAVGGAQGAQQFKASDIANQMNNLALQKQQILQPMQIGMMQSALGGGNTQPGASVGNAPGSFAPPIGSSPSSMASTSGGADQLGAQALMMAYASGDPKQISTAYLSLYEHNPQLAGAIKSQQESQTPYKMPDGTYQLGGGVSRNPASTPNASNVPFSLAPLATSAAIKSIQADREPGGIGPGNQTPAEVPTPEGQGQIQPISQSMLNQPPAPMGGPRPPPPTPSQLAPQMQQGQPQQPSPGGGAGMPQPQPVQGPQQLPPAPQQQPPLPQIQPRQAAFLPPQNGPLAQQPQTGGPGGIQISGNAPPEQGTAPVGGIQALIAQQQAAKAADSQQKPMMATDGKPIIPAIANNPFYKPNPTGAPILDSTPSANTEPAVDAQKAINAAQIKNIYDGDATFTSSLSSLQKEDYRIQQLMDIYHRTQSGTAVAQLPELANRLVSIGAISDPKTIKTVSDAQTAANDHVLQIVNQLKDTNQNLGGAATRTFGSEIASLQENGETFKDQPEALYNILTQARGIVAQNMDMVKGWQDIGGTGNTAAAGKTMMPDQYAQQFMLNHNPDDYRKAVAAQTAPFKGMAASDPISKAKAALASGAPRDLVIKRLTDNNINPAGL